MTEEQAIMYVLRGGHPANALRSVTKESLIPTEGLDDPPEFAKKMIEAIPEEWLKFRFLLTMWLQSHGFPLAVGYRIEERFSVSDWKKRKEEEERSLYLQLKKKFG